VRQADHSCRGALLCVYVCMCVCSRNTVRFKCERVFQTGTSFLGKDVFLIDVRLIFISRCFLR